MALSEVEICNDALIIVGGDLITSLSDSTKEAIICNEQYEKVRDQLLSAHPWNFAIARAELAADVSLPTGWWGWECAFTLPANSLRILETEADESEPWSQENGKLFANYYPVRIKYIKKETDVTKYSKHFEKALAYALADRICYAITQSATLAKKIKDDFDTALSESMSFDGQEQSVQTVQATDYMNSRY